MAVGEQHPKKKNVNRIGLARSDYAGQLSTLCSGCGHDGITNQIIRSFYELGVNPYQVAKLSGIGCASKTPAYFMNTSHGFNGVHGRMPSLATGAILANHKLICIGVSGDGDTASIGLGQFCHLVRRNVPMIYIIENNGVYGLTKGQFSATADQGSKLKTGVSNELPAIDCCSLAIEMGCTFVGRSFAGDPKQVVSLLKACLSHSGTSMLDIISPCVTFNNHEGSTKSYKWAKEHEELLHQIDFIPYFDPIETIDYSEGESREVEMHDGSHIRLRKLDRDYDPMSKVGAMRTLHEAAASNEFLTGLMYVDPVAKSFVDFLELGEEPLCGLPQDRLHPSREALDEIMQELM